MFPRFSRILLAVAVVAAAVPAISSAQTVIDVTETVDFDRPEAWAMKYFASATLLTTVAPPRSLTPGSVELGLELGWIPHLSEEERRVGFNGTKVEDLNRSPVLPRPRVTVGLPWRVALDLSWVPPVEIDGATSNLVAVGLERLLYDGERFLVGARLAGQIGEVEGDFTCPEAEASFSPGGPDNPFGCQEASSDTVHLDSLTAALNAGYRLGGLGDTTLVLGARATYMDLEFQVDALTFDIRDRTRLVTDGWTWSVTGGANWTLSGRTGLAVQAYYTPLDVARDPSRPDDVENDGLLNLRALLRWTWR